MSDRDLPDHILKKLELRWLSRLARDAQLGAAKGNRRLRNKSSTTKAAWCRSLSSVRP